MIFYVNILQMYSETPQCDVSTKNLKTYNEDTDYQ